MLIEQGVPVFERLRISPELSADPALARRARPGARAGARRQRHRHHRPRHRSGLRGQGRAARAARRGSVPARALRRQAAARCSTSTISCCSTTSGSRRWTSSRRWTRSWRRASTIKPLVVDVTHALAGSCATAAPTCCSKARRARCSTSTTAPIRIVTSSNTTGRRSPPPARASGRVPSTTCSASSRPTPRASARVRFPTELFDEYGEHLSRVGHEFGSVTGRRAPLRLVRCGGAAALDHALQRVRAVRHQARRARRPRHRSASASATACAASVTARAAAAASRTTPTVEPVYEELPAGGNPRSASPTTTQLPATARALPGAPAAAGAACRSTSISTGPDREQTIVLRHPVRSLDLGVAVARHALRTHGAARAGVASSWHLPVWPRRQLAHLLGHLGRAGAPGRWHPAV